MKERYSIAALSRRVAMLFLVATALAVAQEEPRYELADCGAEKVIVFTQTISPDRHFAVGCTLRPTRLGVKAVDWSRWEAESPHVFLEQYPSEINAVDAEYRLEDCLIDLRKKELRTLVSDFPYWPGKNRGCVVAGWLPEKGGSRWVLIQNQIRFGTHDLWLVQLDAGGMKAKAIEKSLNQALDRVMRKWWPMLWDRCVVSYLADEATEGAYQGEIKLPFAAEIPKSDEYPYFEGWIMFRPKDLVVTQIVLRQP